MTVSPPNQPDLAFALDHLVLAADSLASGNEYLLQRFGVETQPGGQHLGYGTHNSLLQVGGGTYLEVIAPDPSQPAPDQPRPFGLDSPGLRERIAVRPRLIHYVMRTAQIEALAALIGYDPGPIKEMTRGDLTWQLALRPMAGRPTDMLFPSLINWGNHPSPGRTLPSRGAVMTSLHLRGPHDDCARLGVLTKDRRIQVSEHASAMIAAEFQTPKGWTILD
ncbi:MAG: VOC family protein [Burkholderiaceae bacterium]